MATTGSGSSRRRRAPWRRFLMCRRPGQGGLRRIALTDRGLSRKLLRERSERGSRQDRLQVSRARTAERSATPPSRRRRAVWRGCRPARHPCRGRWSRRSLRVVCRVWWPKILDVEAPVGIATARPIQPVAVGRRYYRAGRRTLSGVSPDVLSTTDVLLCSRRKLNCNGICCSSFALRLRALLEVSVDVLVLLVLRF